jgi:putative sigma-54 modulation protein
LQVKDGHRVEVVTSVKGTTIICKHSSPDMYTSIDAVAHALSRKLRQYKERRTEGWHGGNPMGDDLMQALESLDDDIDVKTMPSKEDDYQYNDTDAPIVTKVNSFDLERPISLQEAVFALDYIDHDFYVFKNAETNKMAVVFKQTGGTVGLVEP